MAKRRSLAGSYCSVADGDHGDGQDDGGWFWGSLVNSLGSLGMLYLLRLANYFVGETLGIPVVPFWGTLLGIWLLWSIIKWVIDSRREAREKKARAIERKEIEQARLAREARFKAGHKLP